MERGQRQITFIDLDERGASRGGVVITLIVVLVAMLVIAPMVAEELAAPAETSRVTTMPAGSSPLPAVCRPAVDVPHLLVPVARIVMPGWTRLCGWISEGDLVELFDPSG